MRTSIITIFLLITIFFLSCEKNSLIIPPKADFSIDSTILFIGDTVQFINLCNEFENETDSTNFLWHFEGGSPEYSHLYAPGVKYPNPGSYSVRLTITNKNGRDSIIKSDFVKIYGMYVGKLDGLNIYQKIFPVPYTKFDSIDINEDGIYDVQFIHSSSCCRNRGDEISVEGLHQTQISKEEDNSNAKSHEEGDIVSPKLLWSRASLCLSGIWQNTDGNAQTTYGECGSFKGVGFICFKINNNTYGWMNLNAGASYFGPSFGIRSFAYFTINP